MAASAPMAAISSGVRFSSPLRLPSQDPARGSGVRIPSPGCLSFRISAGLREIPSLKGVLLRNAEQEALGPLRMRGRGYLPVFCSAGSSSSSSPSSSSWWRRVQQKVVSPEKILRIISGATSSPICQFIESPATVLHSVNPRIKLVLQLYTYIFLLSPNLWE